MIFLQSILLVLLFILGGVLGLLLLILAALLFCAFHYRVNAAKGAGVTGGFRIRWLFVTVRGEYDGGMAFKVRLFGIPVPPGRIGGAVKTDNRGEKKDVKKEIKKEGKKERKKIGMPDIRELRALYNCGIGAVKKILRAIKPKRLSARGVIGLEDPAGTALAVGSLGGFARFKRWDVNVRGDFDTARIEGEISARGRVRLCAVLFPAAGVIMKKPVRELIFGKKKDSKGEWEWEAR